MGSQLLSITSNFSVTAISRSSSSSSPPTLHTLSRTTPYIPQHIYTHPSAILLELCTSLTELHQFLTPVIKSNLCNEHLFQTKLLSLFCKFNSLHDASKVFEPIDDKIDALYHTMLKAYAKNRSFYEAVEFYIRMLCDGVIPIVYTFTYLLKACGDETGVRLGKEIHGQLISYGYSSNLFAMSSVVNMYAKNREVDEAYKMFERMPDRDVVSWNTIIAGYAQNGKAKIALELLLRMQEQGRHPDMVTVVTVLPAVADMGSLILGKSVHGYVVRNGFECFVNVSTALLDMYGKCGSVDTARLIFDRMDEKTVVSWNSLIDGYVQNGDAEEAMDVFEKMLDEGVEPSDVSILEALHACARLGDLQRGQFIHRLADQLGLLKNVLVMNSLISMYSKCRRFDLSADIFEDLPHKTIVSWNAMILGFAENGCAKEALTYFCKMQSENIKPDSFTMVSVIPALTELSILRQAKWVHGLVIRSCFEDNVYVMTALVDMYAKCGDVAIARKLFDMMKERHVITWNAMIDGYGTHGLGKDAIKIFDEMQKSIIKPNGITFLCIISACSHSGLVEEGLHYFTAMKQEYGIEPVMDHYGAVVDLLGRVGRLYEAWDIIQNMPIAPGITIYGAMLGACKIHKNVDLGEKAAEKLFELRPEDGGYHVLLTNIYAAASKWDKVAEVRRLMEKTGLQKTPGCSVLELKSEFHTFYSGSTSHPQSPQIYNFLQKIVEKIKDAGYVPDTNSIHDVEDGIKEKLLNSHSEKLAIAFGLLNTKQGQTIQIRKNLRVCGDCHNATKYISLVTGREIIVRDMHRFHHFSNGICSCGDYW